LGNHEADGVDGGVQVARQVRARWEEDGVDVAATVTPDAGAPDHDGGPQEEAAGAIALEPPGRADDLPALVDPGGAAHVVTLGYAEVQDLVVEGLLRDPGRRTQSCRDSLAGVAGLADDEAVAVGVQGERVGEPRGRLEVHRDARSRGVLSPDHGAEERDAAAEQVGVADRSAPPPEGARVAAGEAGEGGQGLDGVAVVRAGPQSGLLLRARPCDLADDVPPVVDVLGPADREPG
jgi:hypothetical protein